MSSGRDTWGVWEWRTPTPGPSLELLAALLRTLPRDGRWTRDYRRRWLAAMEAAADWTMELRP